MILSDFIKPYDLSALGAYGGSLCLPILKLLMCLLEFGISVKVID